jgi:biopolymer transport protein ExbB
MQFHLQALALVALFCSLGSLRAQTQVSKALIETRRDLVTAIAKLEATREKIAAEKPELSAKFHEVEKKLAEKRRLLRIARMGEADRERELRILNRDLATRKQDANYIAGLLKDHALKVETLAKPGSAPLDIEDAALMVEGGLESDKLKDRLVVIDASLGRLEALLGGASQPGEAVDGEGQIHQGVLAAFGPVSYFMAKDGDTGGEVLVTQSGELPRFVNDSSQSIAKLMEGEMVTVPVDPSGGNARALENLRGGPMALIRKGGLWIWPILLLALLSLIFGLMKLAQFSRFREPSDAWVTAILAALRTRDTQKALQIAGERRHPAGEVMVKLVKTSEHSPDLVEETLYEQLMGVQSRVSTMLPVIAITAATAPLLGLLGTVSGMIATFNLITLFGSGDPKPLAGGISEALITTMFGLVVAIPALIVHAFLSRRAQGIVQTTERLGLSLVNGLNTKS